MIKLFAVCRRSLYLVLLLLITNPVFANSSTLTHRTAGFSNDRVRVWKTVIFPDKSQRLTMHRHEYDRVLVALTDGTLKITNDKGQSHYLHLKNSKAYYLSKDLANERHIDINVTQHPITVVVIELIN